MRAWLATRLPRPRPAAGRMTPEAAILLATVAVLLLLGLVMSFSASFVRSTAETGDPFGIFRRQLVWALVGLVPLLLLARSEPQRWRRFATPILLVALALSALVLVPSIGLEAYGARRWLALGPVTLQPSELLKLAVPLYLAHLLARRWRRVRAGDLHALLMPAVPLLVIVAGLVLAEPDLETSALLVGVGGLVLFTAGLPTRLLLLGGAGLGALGLVAITQVEFRVGRVAAWLDPMADPANLGYQSVQGFLALGSGGWLGTGLGQGRGKWLYLPNADTDFIFAIIGEELGLVGALATLLLYAALAVGGVRTARLAADPFGRLLAVGITGWLLMQATLNIGSVVGLLPVTGVTLPLVSVGGSSLVVTMAGVGALLAIARTTRTPPAVAEPTAHRDGAQR
ncbi:MAG: putative lipid II flippase FtsW [Actinomycetota bacterium]